MRRTTQLFSPFASRRLVILLAFLCCGLAAQAGVLVPFVNNGGGNLPPVIPNPAFITNATIFDLTAANMGTTIPAFPNAMAGDVPLTGGPCAGFGTGEICGTVENAAVGVRAWETVLQNQSGAQQSFWAGFFAPGLVAWVPLTLPNNAWVYFAFPYFGPTVPLWAVSSGLPFPIVMTTSIVDPPSFTAFDICDTGDTIAAICGPIQSTPPNDSRPRLTDTDVPEPGTLPLMGLGIGLLAMAARRFAH